MDKSNKLMFFNKEGYPYNFQYDEIEQKWNGKLLFDENSSEVFKTIGMYVFEKVDPIDISLYVDFEESQLFNWSGMTFVAKTYEDQLITDIEKVNSDPNFHTKWIYGNEFDIKFIPGTIVSFSGYTNELIGPYWSDFVNSAQTYFNVLSTKIDAILISTLTNNQTFDGFTFITGATITSHNVIKVPDYGNQYLVDINNLNYYNGKKLTVVNSLNNDGIYTYNDYSILKNKVFDFTLPSDTTGTLDIELILYTERPILYSGPVDIEIFNTEVSGTTIVFENDINNDIDFFNTGQTMIFEQTNGDVILSPNPIFTINSYKDKELIIENNLEFNTEYDRNFITIPSISGLTGLTYVDQIYLEANPIITGTTGSTLHNGRLFDVVSVDLLYPGDSTKSGVRIEVEQYVSEETNIYAIYKKFKRSQIKTIYAQSSTSPSPTTYVGDANCFITTNVINISQDIVLSGDTSYYYQNTVDALNVRYETYLRDYGVQLYHYNYDDSNYLMVEGIYDYNHNLYFDVTASINDTPLTIGNNFTFTTGLTNSDVYYFEMDEQLINERINLYETNKLNRIFTSEILLDLNNDLIDYGFKVTMNSVEYFINYATTSGTTSYTNQTIVDFIIKYGDVFNRQGFNLYSGFTNDYTSEFSSGYTLNIDGKYPNISVVDIDVFVNIYSEYRLTTSFNNGIVLSSNQLISVPISGTTGFIEPISFYDMELSTGMIVSIDGSEYALNNREYNIISVTNDIIQLSYQGPFFNGYNILTNITTRDFLRKPRSYYDKVIDYKFSWTPENKGEITKDIFFYDYSGNQLTPYNDISGLTYTGIKPLYNESSSTKIYLNDNPNKFENEVNNPSVQQTIFDSINHRLDTLNDSGSYNYTPVPMEVFIGFNSPNEGVSINDMKLEKIEYCVFSGVTQDSGVTQFQQQFILTGNTITYVTNDYLFNITSYGFEVDQLITIGIVDNSLTGQTLHEDYTIYKIKDITSKIIYIDRNYSDNLIPFNTLNQSGKTFTFTLETQPKELLRCKIYGQTEIEDERIDINLRNLGIDIFKEAEFIFKESDIQEHSVDYSRLNRKRKEMLTIYNQIFDYVGSYKALIHSIDYFGYNDLKLYEYYKNIKTDSPLYGKLQKLLIPDIFDNSIEGWNTSDYIENKYDKGYYKKTNLFNLTYRITDVYGNYSLQYSLDDVQIKLMSLVKWLRKNVIPLSSNIRDITGIVDTTHNITLRHDSSVWATKSIIDQEVVSVNFHYSATRVNEGNYLFTTNFYVVSGSTEPEYFTVKIKTYSLDLTNNELIPQQNILLNKTDYDPYSFNMNYDVDPYISIEVTTFNGYGVGYSNSKMFKYDESKNYYLVNSNFQDASPLYVDDGYGYYIIDNGRFYIIKY